MSKKHRKQYKAGESKLVSQRKIVTLSKKLDDIYAFEDLGTSCCRQCTCCRVACPQMKYCEAVNIIDGSFAKWPRDDRKHVLVTSVKYFFSDSLIKPCPLLDVVECRSYLSRPLNCRIYGIWPDDAWKKRVAMFSQSTGLPQNKLPLNVQCPNVRRLPDVCDACLGKGSSADGQKCIKCGGSGAIQKPPLTDERIGKMFSALDAIDAAMGISESKIKSGWNYRTLHDWMLYKFWGEETLILWTNMLLQNSQEERDELVKAFLDAAKDIL